MVKERRCDRKDGHMRSEVDGQRREGGGGRRMDKGWLGGSCKKRKQMRGCEKGRAEEVEMYNLFPHHFIKYIWALEQGEIILTLAQWIYWDLPLWCAESKHTHKRHTHARTHCRTKSTNSLTHTHTFPWQGNQLFQCLSVITPYSPSDGCNTLWRCKMCFGNVFGIALWHCWMLLEWDHNRLRATVIPLWSKWQGAASM